jgi:hypothetical protein
MKRFSELRSRECRAIQAWIILVGLAHRKETISYSAMAVRMGFTEKSAVIISQFLELIYMFCKESELPHLAYLVVGKHTGVPGAWEGQVVADIAKETRKVFAFDWDDIHPPTQAGLSKFAKVQARIACGAQIGI